MRYPITPEFLEELPDPVVRLQRDLENAVLRDVCRRLRLSGELTEGALHQLRALRDRGLDLSHIEKRVLETGRLTQRELDAAFQRALERNRAYYDHLSRKANLLPSGFSLSALAARLDAVRRQTKGEFRNLTQSLGFLVRVGGQKRFLPIARAYQQVLDDAYVQVASGAFDYNAAVKTAVERLAGSGLRYVDYASGRHSRIDVAARRAVLTGVNQVAAQCSAQAMAELDTDLVEVTAHAGARDTGGGFANHKSWQGRVYSFSGRDKRYPGLVEVCGYGNVAGLCGANCRHSFYPFVEGVSQRTYTDRQLADLDPPPFAYQGRTYTAYEATQAQRRLETAIRAQERRWIGLEAAGLEGECQTAAVRLQRLRQEYRHFSAAAGLRVKPARTQVRGWGRAQAARATAGSRTADGETLRLQALDRARQAGLLKDPSLALPNAAHAVLEPEKFLKYLFNRDNPRGYAKGVAFASRLGYDADNWEELREEIRLRAPLYPARPKGDSGHGMKYEQRMILYGKKGAPANVVVSWIEENGTPRMTSAYIKEVKEHDDSAV